jgi:hypothetical protein
LESDHPSRLDPVEKRVLSFIEVQKAIKNKANQHFLAGISPHPSLHAVLYKKTGSCESRAFGRACKNTTWNARFPEKFNSLFSQFF